MACKLVSESGLQLLARLSSRPSLSQLDKVLFPNDLQPGDVVQISGNSGTGKSLLLLHLMTKCLLPKFFKNIEIGGFGAGVILIDTDHSISILKLVSLIEHFIHSSFNVNTSGSVSLKSQELGSIVEEILKDTLNRLIILKTYSSMQLQMNFHSLVKILSVNSNVSILMIDSLTSYYWEDTMNVKNFKKMDLYLKVMIDKLLKSIKDFKIITMFVKQGKMFCLDLIEHHSPVFMNYTFASTDYFQTKHAGSELSHVNHKIDLRKSDENNDLFCAFIDSSKTTHNYMLSEKGFTWMTHQ